MTETPSTEVHWANGGDALLSEDAVCRAVELAAAQGGRAGLALSVVFVDDEHLTQLHAEHLDDRTETDVITFDLGDDGAGPAGELYVSVDRARRVAERRGVEVERELTLYVVHGTLHLVGFDDHEDAERARMRAAEALVLDALGFPPDTSAHEFGVD